MVKRIVKWLLLLAAAVFFLRAVFFDMSAGTLAAFLLCGGGWYWLTRLKTRELDAPKPR